MVWNVCVCVGGEGLDYPEVTHPTEGKGVLILP